MTGATKEEREALVARLRDVLKRVYPTSALTIEDITKALAFLERDAALQAENGERQERVEKLDGYIEGLERRIEKAEAERDEALRTVGELTEQLRVKWAWRDDMMGQKRRAEFAEERLEALLFALDEVNDQDNAQHQIDQICIRLGLQDWERPSPPPTVEGER